VSHTIDWSLAASRIPRLFVVINIHYKRTLRFSARVWLPHTSQLVFETRMRVKIADIPERIRIWWHFRVLPKGSGDGKRSAVGSTSLRFARDGELGADKGFMQSWQFRAQAKALGNDKN
jgi:hypothetical protein